MKDGITFYNGIFVNSHLMEMAFHFEMGNFENPMHFLAPVSVKVDVAPQNLINPSNNTATTINMIDIAPGPVDDKFVKVNNVANKRRRVTEPPAVAAAAPVVSVSSGSGASGSGLGKKTNKGKKAVRAPPRRVDIPYKNHNVWDVLKNVNAGLSVTDCLKIDKTASKQVLDGIRTLRSRKRSSAAAVTGTVKLPSLLSMMNPARNVTEMLRSYPRL
jgi:hypothetical protein